MGPSWAVRVIQGLEWPSIRAEDVMRRIEELKAESEGGEPRGLKQSSSDAMGLD